MQINNMKKFLAVTLGEVLVSLTVIGVVFAITVPVLKNHTDSVQMESLLKKTYLTLNQAIDYSLAKDEEDSTDDWDFRAPFLRPRLLKYIHVDKTCSQHSTECFANYSNSGKYIYLRFPGDNNDVTVETNESYIIFNTVALAIKPCEKDENGSFSKACFFVDLNGTKKPNMNGYDLFKFTLTKGDSFVKPEGYSARIMDNDWKINYWD